MSQVVLRENRDGVACLKLNRPQALNALNEEMALALRDSCAEIAGDDGVRCLVIGGSAGHFMAGGDVAFFHAGLQLDPKQREQQIRRLIQVVHETVLLLRRMPKPVVASVQGMAAGFGVSLVAACDLAVAAEDALFRQAYLQIGTTPDGGNTFFLPRLIGSKRSMAFSLLGDAVDAKTALQMGLVNQVTPVEELEAAVDHLAQRIVRGSARAQIRAKQLLNASPGNSLEQQLDAELQNFLHCAMEADFAEGVTAFVEKRPPGFGGR